MTLGKILILLFLSVQLRAQNPIQIFWALNRPASSACTDADYTKFVTKITNAGGSLTTTEKSAICTLVKQLKDSSLWTTMFVIYPMVGGSASSVVINLKDTVNYNATLVASPTVSSNGIAWNGTTQYANTNFNPNGIVSLNSTTISYYSRTNTATNASDMGETISGNYILLGIHNTMEINSTNTTSFSNTDTRGLFTLTRTASNSVVQYRNGLSVSTETTVASVAVPNGNMYFGARNLSGAASNFTDRQCAFITIGSGLSAAQALTLYRIVQAFQTTLGRQV